MKKNRKIFFWVLTISTTIVIWSTSNWGRNVVALPPPEDIPEEILRTEIIIDARSPVDGKPLNAAQYAELQEQLQVSPPPKLSTNVRQTVYLLKLRKALLQIFPFLDI
ncbi:hypothetical protein [Umezakia ovalisporum]|uniref:Glutathione S-transferase n=2 Tax=Umezakia ovalisporum TaxID=75695 RepID=A0AA43GYM6_9CYAN|nr:hypothetical protein [Umezakia ovalisporum]MDH6056554.1 hypothetical protein [Umezakia ovalisporum FSS-43]MDH6064072.1 hypothetical protein [Umezakia ovalisporum FSS-62]MDH6065794.1 hypothetical protein [Umezakia ovalisporum APH033B]MDH6069304.1 hypothetical protein [Umezakia ovalisporum CobakiLakeA]MDH6076186.1 hypothetical protein [Umezakia ovalisporum CS-1034]